MVKDYPSCTYVGTTFFSTPGGRMKLCKQDLYELGADRGGIDERWLASTMEETMDQAHRR